METGLDGKVAIVTGGSGGIGLACARALAAEGARVVLGDLNAEALAAAVAELGDGVADRRPSADVSRPDDAQRLVDVALERFGRLDVLVASAGVHRETRLDAITPEEWDLLLGVNLRGVFLTAQAALRVIVPQGSGRIVVLGSLSSQTGGLAASAAYAASKGGVIDAHEVDRPLCGPARHHGELRQPRHHRQPDDRDVAGGDERAPERGHPLGRLGTTDEVASVGRLPGLGRGLVRPRRPHRRQRRHPDGLMLLGPGPK